MDLESLFGEQGSTATQITLTKDRSSPLVGKVVLFDQLFSFRRDAHGSVREEGDTPSQPDQPNQPW